MPHTLPRKPKRNTGQRYQLIEEIIDRSEADTWQEAKREWELVNIYFAPDDELEECLCGKQGIREVCILQNKLNQNFAVVGNKCVTKFVGINSDALVKSVDRIQTDPAKAPNADLITFAHDNGWINDWEHGFSMDTYKKRRLSKAQTDKRIQINRKITEEFVYKMES